jgi:hexosaminidase
MNEKSAVIPLPVKTEYLTGSFTPGKEIDIICNSEEITDQIDMFREFLMEQDIEDIHLLAEKDTVSTGKEIIVNYNLSSDYPAEGYKLTVSPEKMELSASAPQGIFYGIQTIKQLIVQQPEGKISVPAQKIEDFPRFVWRGMHLDVSRHFMPKEFIKEYIDYMAFLKMNVFHWHLVDDQGWRIEIKQYPELTATGAWRNETLIGHYSDEPRKYDGKRYGGYYTQEDIREIVAYAASRFITIVPEIEIPGHSQAAIAAYPELGCTEDSVEVRTIWGISPYIYNVDESTFTFLENVLSEVIGLFPSRYIHIGGDEALKDQWKASRKVQKRMEELGIADEQELQSYFIGRIEEFLLENGRNIIGWDEILEGGLAPTAAVMSWRGTEGGIEAAENGHYVVMTPTDYCYFDYYQSQADDEPLAIGGFLPVEKVYSYDPVPAGLPADKQQYISGVQGNVWTEYMETPEQVEYMIFPRIFAMAEIQWTPSENKDYSGFVERLNAFEPFLQDNNINYARHLFRK